MAKTTFAAAVRVGMRIGGCTGTLQVVKVERQGNVITLTGDNGKSYSVPFSQVLYKLN